MQRVAPRSNWSLLQAASGPAVWPRLVAKVALFNFQPPNPEVFRNSTTIRLVAAMPTASSFSACNSAR
jgi:hypothetical protein